MLIPSMQDLLEAGVHFGHQTRKWHPKMGQFIFGAKDKIHIIDLEKTVDKLSQACKFLAETSSAGGAILFVGTKRQAAEIIKTEAVRCGMPYITERWIGGLLTNFDIIHKNIEKLTDLEAKRQAGEFSEFTKKERLLVDREISRLERYYGGLRDFSEIPAAIFIVDVKREETACREAQRCAIPVVAICDTNANLDLVDYPIPGNDDAVKAVTILVQNVADAIVEGRKGTKEIKEPEETPLRPFDSAQDFAGQAKKATKKTVKKEIK